MCDKKINEHVDTFLHNFKVLIKEIYAVLPNNPNIYRANKRIHLLIMVDPRIIIEKVGEKLFKYKDSIYDDDIEKLSKKINMEIVDTSTADLATLLVEEIKICLSTLSENQKRFFRKLLCDLLDEYLEYKVLTIHV